jgi:RND family efflux transporter MFP subunit
MTESQNPSRQTSGNSLWVIALIIGGIALAAVYLRMPHTQAPQASGAQPQRYIATVMMPEASAADGLVLPGELHPYLEAAIYARTNGYLKSRKVELGASVKQGELLAEIDSPETDQQLKQAQADLASAQANYQVAQITADRWTKLLATHAVSPEDVDLKTAEAHAKKAQVASAQANAERLEKLEGFEKVIAPFDGIITARNVDTGTLISSGNTSAEQELFHIADITRLRVLVQVPQQQAQLVKPGITATLTLAEQAGQKIPAQLMRTAQAIDPTTHTLLAELEVDNSQHTLLSGGYCEVHLPLSAAGSFRIPASALVFGSDGLKVATVDAALKVAVKPVTVGQDFGKQVEITTGLAADDRVIINPWDSIASGQGVTANTVPPTDTAAKK